MGLIGELWALREFPRLLSLCWMMEEMTLLSRRLPVAGCFRNAAGGGGSSVMGLGLLLGVDAFIGMKMNAFMHHIIEIKIVRLL